MGLPYEDADDLRAHLETFGEYFDTGYPERLLAEWFDEPDDIVLGDQVVRSRMKRLRCLTSDVELHRLVQGSTITRLSDDSRYAAKDFERDGVGLTFVRLGK